MTTKINPFVTGRNKTETSTRNSSSLIEISYKYDFRSLVDYCRLFQFIIYLIIVTVLYKKFAKYLTELCSTTQKFDIEVGKTINGKLKGFGKLYIGIFFELLYHSIYLTSDMVNGILHPDWWLTTMTERIFYIIYAISHTWLLIVQVMFDYLLTISFIAIKQRFGALTEVNFGDHKHNAMLSLIVDILAHFESTFGGILTLHLSFYTFDVLTKTFDIIILGARGYLGISLVVILSLIGTSLRIYHIVSVGEQLTKQVLSYTYHLDECNVNTLRDSRERKVYEK
jgi:hypothetical protein